MSAASYVVTGLALIAAYWTSIKSMAIPPVASEKERSVTGGKGYVLTVRYYNTLLNFMFTVYFAIEFGALSVSALSARPGHFVNRQVNRDICPPKAAFYERPSAEHSALHLLPISTLSLLGLTMAILAASLRVYARATMGNLFRYEISIQKSHKLITSGPYAYVRHPGYTGGSLMCIGLLIFILSPGTFLSECLTTNPIVIFAKLYMGAFFAYMPIWTVFWRTEEEDKLLRKEFGAQWDEWARRTKYKVIPFVY